MSILTVPFFYFILFIINDFSGHPFWKNDKEAEILRIGHVFMFLCCFHYHDLKLLLLFECFPFFSKRTLDMYIPVFSFRQAYIGFQFQNGNYLFSFGLFTYFYNHQSCSLSTIYCFLLN